VLQLIKEAAAELYFLPILPVFIAEASDNDQTGATVGVRDLA
jgi:hypothetical protein